MALLKCKMCGGDLHVEEGMTVCECEYCNTKQTVPSLDDDKKVTLFARANRLRSLCEFDKAYGVYESIVVDYPEEAEAYWGLILCKYGIEYVDDPATAKKIPTCHRSSFESVLEDTNFEMVLEYSDTFSRAVYREEAKEIEELRKGIIEISGKEEPYDIFICYKETDENGERTIDSVIAQDVYKELTSNGYRVFFSRITLEDKLGQEYEPYIFAALHSSKVMLVFGTDYEYFNAVWVKNEWSRYLQLISQGEKKTLIPCYKGIDAYDMPKEFAHLQAQDMGKVGATQDLLRGIDKLFNRDSFGKTQFQTQIVTGGGNVEALLERALIFLEDGEWEKADETCELALNQDPKNAQAYIVKLMAELRVHSREQLADCDEPFNGSNNYKNAVRFGGSLVSDELSGYIDAIKERNENNRIMSIYNSAVDSMKAAKAEEEFKAASKAFKSISGFKDSDELAQSCLDKAEECRKDAIYKSARGMMSGTRSDGYISAIALFKSISGWKDSDKQIEVCQKAIDNISAKEEERRLERERKTKRLKKIVAIVTPTVIICIVLVGVFVNVILPKMKYNKAMSLINSGDYDAAYSILHDLGDDATVIANKNERAQNLLASGDYEAAYALFMELGDEEAIVSSITDRAMALFAEEDYDAAYVLLEEFGNNEAINSSITDRAMVLASSGDYETGRSILEEIGNTESIPECTYDYGLYLVDTGDYVGAYNVLAGLNYSDSNELLESIMPQVYDAPLTDVEVGSYVFFGSYEQDNDLSNGAEPIEWCILEVDGDRILLLSRYALDARQYNPTNASWNNSSLRAWLNDDFYNQAFTASEQNMIQTTDDTINHASNDETLDRVFVLSRAQFYTLLSGLSVCRVTDYLEAQEPIVTQEGICSWWLRDVINGGPAFVGNDGEAYWSITYNGNNSFAFYYGVRPAIWISLGSDG